MTKIHFVTFYADGGGVRPAISGDLDGPAQIELLVRSARKFHPDAAFTVLTDGRTNLANLPEDVHIERDNIDLSRIMFERMRLQQKFLNSVNFDSPVVFTDTDVLVCRSLYDVFEINFDIAFTWRKSDEMPINGGVIYINSKSAQKSRELFGYVLRKYSEVYTGTSSWYGDQFAILSLINLPFSEIYKSPTIERFGGNIALLDCERFNYSPNGDRPNLRDFRADVKIYHFKGMSRRIMRQFWEIHLSGENSNYVYRELKMTFQNIKLIIQRKNYLLKLKKDEKRFNAKQQEEAVRVDLTETAARLLSKRLKNTSPICLSEIGCRDQILHSILVRQGLKIDYHGFDLQPRSASVRKFNIEKDPLPPCDVAVVLGILEHVDELAPSLARLVGAANMLVISYPNADHQRVISSSRRDLQRRPLFSPHEVEAALSRSGYRPLARELTFNERTIVWLCESMKIQPPTS